MLASIAEVGFVEKPDFHEQDNGAYLDSFVLQDIEPIDLANHICQGDSFTNVFDGRPKTSSFIMGSIIAVDLDESPPLGALLTNPFVASYATLVYPTFSSTEDRPRHRVVFCLEEELMGIENFERCSKAIYRMFPGADRQCAGAARTFLGNGSLRGDYSRIWFTGKLMPLYDLWLLVRQQESSQVNRRGPVVRDGPVDRAVEWAIAHVREGERNHVGYWLACRLHERGLDEAEAMQYMKVGSILALFMFGGMARLLQLP